MTKTLAVHYADNTYKTPCGRLPVTIVTDWATVTCQTCLRHHPFTEPIEPAIPEWMTTKRTDAEQRALAGDRSVWTPTVHRGRIVAHRAARFRRQADAFMGYFRQAHDPADHARAMRHYALAFQAEYHS